ncbi:MAG: hypothetical protein ACLFVF_07100 [Thiohalospira sp.]
MEIAESALSLVRSTTGDGGGDGESRSRPAGEAASGESASPEAASAAGAGVSAGDLPVGANTIVQRNIDLLLGGLTYTSDGGASGGGSSSGNLVDASA